MSWQKKSEKQYEKILRSNDSNCSNDSDDDGVDNNPDGCSNDSDDDGGVDNNLNGCSNNSDNDGIDAGLVGDLHFVIGLQIPVSITSDVGCMEDVDGKSVGDKIDTIFDWSVTSNIEDNFCTSKKSITDLYLTIIYIL